MGSWLPNAVRALYREHTDHMLAIVMTEGARNQAFFLPIPRPCPVNLKGEVDSTGTGTGTSIPVRLSV